VVLVDTSVWVSHFKNEQSQLVNLLLQDAVYIHPLIIAEITCGTPPSPRSKTLSDLAILNQANIATHKEVMAFIEAHKLYGRGCGFVDLALLASAILTERVKLWTFDKRLILLAKEFGVSF